MINIAGQLHAATAEGVLVAAEEVKDATQNKTQSTINEEVQTALNGKQPAGSYAAASHTHSQYLTAHQTIKTINGQSLVGSGNITIQAGGINLVEKTYSELVTLRNNHDLTLGQWYRITDYVTEVGHGDEEARSNERRFDIIVMAIDNYTLAEEAYAAPCDKEDFFDDSNLAAWKLWYCLDNDANRFKWADPENGRGVIYRMIDEFGNDVPYDFKNIMFKRYKTLPAVRVTGDNNFYVRAATNDTNQLYAYKHGNTAYFFEHEVPEFGEEVFLEGGSHANKQVTFVTPSDFVGVYGGIRNPYGYGIDENDYLWAFTFGYDDNDKIFEWTTQNADSNNACHDNVIKEYYDGLQQCLNNITITDDDGLGDDMYGNTFGVNCHDNTVFGYSFYGNTFGNECYGNSFSYYCNNNSFGNDCYDNTFGSECFNNIFGSECHNNIFGNDCNNFSFGNDCAGNSFGNLCNNNSFGSYCYKNIFGNDCGGNSFGSECNNNSFGNECGGNSFGNYCGGNSFGNYCNGNSFGNECGGNSFGNYIRYITVHDGVQFVDVVGGEVVGNVTSYVQNAQILSGTQGTNQSLLQIRFQPGVPSSQFAGLKSGGNLMILIPADIV